MSPNNGYKTTCNTLYHKVIEISSVLSRSWLFFYLPSTRFSCFWIELVKDEKTKSKFKAIQGKSNCASSVCVQTNAPRARWGSTPIPFDITGRTGDELSGDATLKLGRQRLAPSPQLRIISYSSIRDFIFSTISQIFASKTNGSVNAFRTIPVSSFSLFFARVIVSNICR